MKYRIGDNPNSVDGKELEFYLQHRLSKVFLKYEEAIKGRGSDWYLVTFNEDDSAYVEASLPDGTMPRDAQHRNRVQLCPEKGEN